MKEEFLKILRTVKREGIEDLIKFIESTDFLQHLPAQDSMEIMQVDL